LTNGEIVVGAPAAGKDGGLSVRPEFLAADAAPFEIALTDVERYEAPWKPSAPVAKKGAGSDTKTEPPIALLHDVILQSGERLRTRLVSLDEREAVLLLGHGAQLTLPRATLRRINVLRPRQLLAGYIPEEPKQDEKPGVELFTKADLVNSAAPQATDEPVDPKNNPAQGLQRLDDVAVVSYTRTSHEITLKDENGEFSFDMRGVKAIVFAAAPATPARQGHWTLRLRDGPSFVAELLELAPEQIVVEIAGGKVVIPVDKVDSVERAGTR
jgi:hypothetical protein